MPTIGMAVLTMMFLSAGCGPNVTRNYEIHAPDADVVNIEILVDAKDGDDDMTATPNFKIADEVKLK